MKCPPGSEGVFPSFLTGLLTHGLSLESSLPMRSSHSGSELDKQVVQRFSVPINSGVPVPDLHRFALIKKMEVNPIITKKHVCVHKALFVGEHLCVLPNVHKFKYQ